MSWHGEIITYTDEDDWLEKRRDGIGASDVAAILGMSPYATPFSVWADKVHGTEKEPTYAMTLGKKLEDIILESFTEQEGLYVGSRQLLVQHPQFAWARATVDGLVYESPPDFDLVNDLPFALGVIEAKSDGSFRRWEEIPAHHQIQVQWQMLVTGLSNAWLAVLHGRRFEVYELAADPGAQNMMLDKVTDFLGKHVQPIHGDPVPPDPDGHRITGRSINELWPSTTADETIELSRAMVDDLDELSQVKRSIKQLENRKKTLEQRIRVAMQDAEIGLVDGDVAVTLRDVNVDGHWRDGYSYRRLDVRRKGDET